LLFLHGGWGRRESLNGKMIAEKEIENRRGPAYKHEALSSNTSTANKQTNKTRVDNS
jgi:hypothetical protein